MFTSVNWTIKRMILKLYMSSPSSTEFFPRKAQLLPVPRTLIEQPTVPKKPGRQRPVRPRLVKQLEHGNRRAELSDETSGCSLVKGTGASPRDAVGFGFQASIGMEALAAVKARVVSPGKI